MYKEDGQLVYSPSDLIRFLESPYAAWMERYHLEQPGELTPDEQSAEMKLVAETGNRHEAAFLARLERAGPVTKIERGAKAEAETLVALKQGDACIYQACLRHGPFRGYADFLRRAPGPSGISYEVWDTKLARETRTYYLVQLCCYAEMLEPALGHRPATLAVALGSGEEPRYPTAEFFHYYLQVKAAFLTLMQEFDPSNPPEPNPRADHGRWNSHAVRWLDDRDHLVRVAGISQSQIRKLRAAKINTVAELAQTRIQTVPRLSPEMLDRLKEQAQLQVETREKRANAKDGQPVPPSYRVLPAPEDNPRRGLALLPPPCPADVFFDMEGYPLAENGLEYLFGACVRSRGAEPEFLDWWAANKTDEKKAFEGFIDWVHDRWQQHPQLHIYHYASYETTALKRLAGAHGTREDKLDDLLRHGTFVDLYQVVRQGLRVGEPSYSIKYVEHLYRGARAGDVATAGESLVFFANWLESGESHDWRHSPILRKIRDYNRDDCVSTLQLFDWLLRRQGDYRIAYVPALPKPAREADDPKKQAKEAEAQARLDARAEVVTTLMQRLAREKDAESACLHTLFLQLLEFHRREEKPVWWRLFSRAAAEVAELKDDLDCIGGAMLASPEPEQVKRSKVFTYNFDPDQDTKIRAGSQRVYALPNLAATFEVESFSEAGEIRVKIGDSKLKETFPDGPPAVTSFAPHETVPAGSLKDAIESLVAVWAAKTEAPPALLRLLRRQPPALPPGEYLRRPGENIGVAAVRCVLAMKESTLCLQGPPGTGKTYCAAQMIAALVAQGKSVGVLSTSHKAIENLLDAACSVPGFKAPILKVGGDGGLSRKHRMISTVATSSDGWETFDRMGGGDSGRVVGGTAWLFARPEWAGGLDCLFVDEAGQVPLANLVAVSACTRNLVLLGDQMQLEQPVQGSHPGDSGLSGLSYYLAGHQTIPAELGLFLDLTYRLEPEVCAFVSESIYEGRLRPAPGNAARRLRPMRDRSLLPRQAGLAFIPIRHEGNTQSSNEEVDAIKNLIRDLNGRTKIDEHGQPAGTITHQDILVVAPYNAQVRRLSDALPKGIRVGSVDKFQGQEADVVIVSMCSSFGEYGSRGLEFLLDENRLNVAITRARTLALVVGDPRIAETPASSIPAMHRLNLFCRLVQSHMTTV